MEVKVVEGQKNIFDIKNVSYKNILQGISFSIEDEKTTCIIGKSGSGKTTILKLLNKLISPETGEVYYKQKNITELDAVKLRREVAMISQTPAVFLGTVRDNLLIALKFAEKNTTNISDDDLQELLDFVKLNKALDDDSEKLSGGEKQRLTLARILLLDPKVFLLDEPTANLDEYATSFIIEKLSKHIKALNKTLVMVTHSSQIAKAYADKIIEIEAGKIKNGKCN